MIIKRATLCSKSCMIYLAKMLSFLIVCSRHIQVCIEFYLNVETVRDLGFLWEIILVSYY